MKRLPGRKNHFHISEASGWGINDTSPTRGWCSGERTDEGMMSGYSRWWREMIRAEESDIRNVHNRICGAAGGRNSAGSLNRQFNHPNKNHLTRPSCPKRIGKEKWGNRPLHCTNHAFNLRSIHLWSDYLNAICLLACWSGVRAGASEQPIWAL